MRDNKDRKLVIRLSAELDDAIGVQADLEALDKSAWARRQLALALRQPRSGEWPVTHSGLVEISPQTEQPEAHSEANGHAEPPSADPESIVASALADAEAQGLTEPQEQEERIPESGVRALVRPAVPFTPNSHQHLNRYLEHLK